jgi:hypothetical protein
LKKAWQKKAFLEKKLGKKAFFPKKLKASRGFIFFLKIDPLPR